MTPYERLMAEELPTGTFGHSRPSKAREAHSAPWTTEEQARHLADLNAALDGWQDPSERAEQKRSRNRPPHLHLINLTSRHVGCDPTGHHPPAA